MKRHILTVVATSAALAAPVSAQVTIDRIAPENSILVLGADSVQGLLDNAQRTQLWALWQSKEIRDLTKEFVEEFAQGMADMYEELGVEDGTLVHPQGPAGAALYTVTDEQTLRPKLAVFAFADYADNADKFGEFTDALLAKLAEDWDTEFDVEDLLGREVHVIEQPEAAEEPAEDEMDFDEFGGNPFMPDPEALAEQFKKIYVLRDGSRFLASSDPESLRAALEVIDGDKAPAVGDREDFRAALGQVGPHDGYALMLTRDFGGIVDALDESGMMRGMVGPSVPALIGTIGAFGYGYRLDAPSAMLEQTVTMYMPEGKGGIFGLLDTATPRGELPAFAGPETISYTSLNFEFGGVLNFVRNVINSNPMLAMQAAEQMPVIEQFIGQMCSPLGQHVQFLRTLRRPLAADSSGMVVSIECTDQQAFEQFLADNGAAAGLEPRDFLGHRIYSTPEGLMGMMFGIDASVSLGLGGGQLFLGSSSGVEQALRTVGQRELASLGGDDEYRRAVGALGNGALVGWGYSDVIDSMEAEIHNQRLQVESMVRQMEEFDPEMAAEMKAEMQQQLNIFDHVDPELLRRYIGPSAWMVRSTDDGFVFTNYVLEAKPQ